jgi:N-acetyl-alpha-D-muramate 1-phosphate uridylyltransferase
LKVFVIINVLFDLEEIQMKAMILAAGRGERMRPLTDQIPKPLLIVRGKCLIEWHLLALARSGVTEVVINTAWLEEKIWEVLGDGSRFGVHIHYSKEGRDHGGALETAGGIAKALPFLGDIFWLISSDIYVPGFAFDASAVKKFVESDALAHLWLVSNPPFHIQGDFGLDDQGYALSRAGVDDKTWTYANIALCRADLCRHVQAGQYARLGPVLIDAIKERRVTAQIYPEYWENVGTPQQLKLLG